LVKGHFSSALLATQLQNLILVVRAMLCAKTMQIAYLSRALPTATTFHHRQKRLLRFFANSHFQPATLFPILLTMILKLRPFTSQVPVIVDETDLPMQIQALFASIPYRGRALAFAFATFRRSGLRGSQNQIENAFFAGVTTLLRLRGLTPVFILDRGYADVKLMRYLGQELKVHYVIRVPNNVWVAWPGYVGRLKDLMQSGQWVAVRYHRRDQELVNLVTLWGKDHNGVAELIYLVSDLDPANMQGLYRQRMRIEECFKDLKHALGLKRLRLRIDIEVRMGRVVFGALLAAAIAGYLYDWAVVSAAQVVKHVQEMSFVQLVVQVCRCHWYAAQREFG